MKFKYSALLFLSSLFFLNEVRADSPLTSTNISEAYKNLPIIIIASNSEGILTNELIEYLLDKENPIDIKMALINELGWDIDGKNNAEIFLEYLKINNYYESEKDFLENGKGYELLSMAYLKALDDYFDVRKALGYAEKAILKKPDSYTFNIIKGLIEAQTFVGGPGQPRDWCKLYQATDVVRSNKALEADMKKGAIKIIFDYMDSYQSYCE